MSENSEQASDTSNEIWESLVEEATYLHRNDPGMRMAIWAEALLHDHTRELGMAVLAKDTEIHEVLGPVLCRSPVVVGSIYWEVVTARRLLSFPNQLKRFTERTRDALTLLKCIASHPGTRMVLKDASVTNSLIPFLEIPAFSLPFDSLRLGCLGFLNALLQDNNEEIVQSLTGNTRLVDATLYCLTRASESSKSAAAFILYRILSHEYGLRYCCLSPELFYGICRILAPVIAESGLETHILLLTSVVGCYLKLSRNPRACCGLANCLPNRLRNVTWAAQFRNNPHIAEWVQQIQANIAQVTCDPFITRWNI